jgi:hypothetical protein
MNQYREEAAKKRKNKRRGTFASERRKTGAADARARKKSRKIGYWLLCPLSFSICTRV